MSERVLPEDRWSIGVGSCVVPGEPTEHVCFTLGGRLWHLAPDHARAFAVELAEYADRIDATKPARKPN